MPSLGASCGGLHNAARFRLVTRFLPATLRPRWVGRRIRGGANPRGACGVPPRAGGRPAGSRAGRSVRLSRRRPVRPRSDVLAGRRGWARAPDRRRGRQLAGRALVRRLRARRSRPRVAPGARRCTIRGHTKTAPADASARTPLIGPRLGRYLFSNATRDASRKFWGQVLVEHPERVDDGLLDVDVAHTRRNVESMLSLIACIADWRLGTDAS